MTLSCKNQWNCPDDLCILLYVWCSGEFDFNGSNLQIGERDQSSHFCPHQFNLDPPSYWLSFKVTVIFLFIFQSDIFLRIGPLVFSVFVFVFFVFVFSCRLFLYFFLILFYYTAKVDDMCTSTSWGLVKITSFLVA